MRSKKSAHLFKDVEKKSRRLVNNMNRRLKKIPHARGVIGAGVVATVLAGFAGAAMLVAAREPFSEPAGASTVLHADTAAPAATASRPAPGAKQKSAPAPSVLKKAATQETAAAENAAIAKETAPAAAPPIAAVAEASSPARGPAVTLTGCLVRDAGTFRLKDTVGAEAPRARSWKSGFLMKRPASIDVIDAASALGLPNYVGERVTVTGLLEDREMRARTLKLASGSCS